MSGKAEVLGKAPGSLVFVGEQKVDLVTKNAIIFNVDHYETKSDVDLHSISSSVAPELTTWVNIVGLHEPGIIEEAGNVFGLHLLTQEDIMNTSQRPKFDEFPDYLFIVIKLVHTDENADHIDLEQLSLIVTKDVILSFQEIDADVFNPIRERIQRPTTKIRHRKSDYLAFVLLDAIVDQYIFDIERFGEKIEALERELLDEVNKDHLHMINTYKSEVSLLRKSIRPVRELVAQFKKSESELIRPDTLPYLADLEDHITQATEALEVQREMLNDILNVYNSALSNKLNDILRVLTIFSVVFIPLTFLAGIYGTNFKYLPELDYQYAYPIFWVVLILIAGLMVYFFKRRNWL